MAISLNRLRSFLPVFHPRLLPNIRPSCRCRLRMHKPNGEPFQDSSPSCIRSARSPPCADESSHLYLTAMTRQSLMDFTFTPRDPNAATATVAHHLTRAVNLSAPTLARPKRNELYPIPWPKTSRDFGKLKFCAILSATKQERSDEMQMNVKATARTPSLDGDGMHYL